MSSKISWKVFFDLQCPYSKVCWKNLPAIRARFQDKYDFSIVITSLAFHPQAFTGQCAATLIGNVKGPEARAHFEDACFEHQDSFMNAALGDCKKSDVDKAFAHIASVSGLFDETLTEEYFLANLSDWEKAVKPAYAEHKVALGYGVYGTPKHVINEVLIPDTESAWGVDEWAKVLEKM